MIPYVAVPGTWAYGNDRASDWWKPNSPFAGYLHERGFERFACEPFIWSTDINGTQFWRRWFGWLGLDQTGDHNDWKAGGSALRWYYRGSRAGERTVIAHSHGGQVAAYAAAQGLRIETLITVATPVRGDMHEVYAAARKNVGCWLHLHATIGGDRMQWLGSLGDGIVSLWRPAREMPMADINHGVPLMQHSRALNDASCFPWWEENGWLDIMRRQGR